jgi:hypothetical protein
MSAERTSYRRHFLGQMFGVAAAASFSASGARVAAQESGPDGWSQEVKGRHRCLE